MATETQQATIKIRRDTAANWTSNDPTPLEGEWCMETDTKKIKIGDGTTAWSSLDYRYEEIADFLKDQVCTAWVNFNGTGTVAIRDSFNVSSITDNGGAGDYTINFATAMDNTNYSFFCTGGRNNLIGLDSTGTIKSINALKIQAIAVSGSDIDVDECNVLIFGGKS